MESMQQKWKTNTSLSTKLEDMISSIPSKDILDKQAFSMDNNAIHFGVNSGLSVLLSSPECDFMSLQLTRISWTLAAMAVELESASLLVSRKMSESLRNAKSLLPIFRVLSSVAVEMMGFNNLIRKRMQVGDSKMCSSWPWNSEIKAVKTILMGDNIHGENEFQPWESNKQTRNNQLQAAACDLRALQRLKTETEELCLYKHRTPCELNYQ